MAEPDPTPLVVRPAGGVRVATDELWAHLADLERLAVELRSAERELLLLEREPWPAPGFRPALAELEHARRCCELAAGDAEQLRRGVDLVIDAYSATEARAEQLQRSLTELAAAHAAPVVALLLLAGIAAAPGLLTTGLLTAAAGRLTGTDPLGVLRRATIANPRILGDPSFVRAVELATGGLDEVGASLAGLPAPVTAVLGATGVLGVPTTAATVAALGSGVGLLAETPVRIDRTRIASGGAPPEGAEERLARIPEGDQVRIERYDAPGLPSRWIVYVGPTETFSPVATDEPWDMTSNIAAVAGTSGGSFRATELAMREAGIAPGDEVQFVGYSQGGLVAARLAGSEHWNAVALETFAAPTGSVRLPAELPGMAVRHTDDLVPALAGPHPLSGQLVVERRAYPDGAPLPVGEPVPAHLREAYAETARQIDRAASPQLREERARVDAFATDYAERPGATVTSYTFHAARMPG